MTTRPPRTSPIDRARRPGAATLALCAAALLLVALAPPAVAQDSESEKLDADAIVDKALERNRLGFDSGAAQVALVVKNRAGDKKTKKLDVKSKKIDDRGHTLVELTAPKSVAGQAFLFVEKKSGADDVWMYLPAFSVTRRIAGSQKEGSFLGSHFTYEDLESRDIKESAYERKEDDKIGKNEVYVVEAKPKEKSDSKYAKIELYIRKKDFIPLKIKYFDADGKLKRTLFTEKIDKTEGGDVYIKRSTLYPKKGGSTTIVVQALDADTEIPDSLFSKGQLGK
jgi:outer membrane lipoprotein-sorting protein